MPARWREPIQPTLILIFILTLLLSVLEQICALNDCRYRFFIQLFVWIYGNEIESGSHRITAMQSGQLDSVKYFNYSQF